MFGRKSSLKIRYLITKWFVSIASRSAGHGQTECAAESDEIDPYCGEITDHIGIRIIARIRPLQEGHDERADLRVGCV